VKVEVINDTQVLVITQPDPTIKLSTPGPQGPVGAAGSADQIAKGGSSITIDNVGTMTATAPQLDVDAPTNFNQDVVLQGSDLFVNGGTIYGDGSGLTGVMKPYVHTQNAAASVWVINHNLGRWPSVTTTDTLGRPVFGDVQYVSNNQVTVTFSVALSGTAYLN
jgi:hypothetical protein